MNCPACQTENPQEARFCMNCGSSLTVKCLGCSTKNPAGAKFCLNCGQSLAGDARQSGVAPQSQEAATLPQAPTQRALQQFIPKELLARLEKAQGDKTLQGERRVVTMLFCDVKGSTEVASQLDPEEWAEIINSAFEHMIRPVYRFEGTVARLMGDGLLAFFGAPIAHEDDPQRAVLAGLQIVEEIHNHQEEVARQWGIKLDVRVGINTGLVVVGAVGSDLRMEYTALGDAINLAARMEQTGLPGTVQVAEPTYKLIAPLFEAESLGMVEVKGKSDPVPAYRIIRQKEAPGKLRGIAGLDAPLIGRTAEIELLIEAVERLKQGIGQVVSVIGEAALGKSRLISELRESSLMDVNLSWIEGRSQSYEISTPYAPFLGLFSEYLGLKNRPAGELPYDFIKSQLVVSLPDQGEELAPFISVLLGVTPAGADLERVKFLEPLRLRSQIFTSVATFFERLAERQPVVLVLDDLHWIDPTSLELLESLLPLTEKAVLMILVAFRPRRQEPSWGFHEKAGRVFPHRYSEVPLQPLNEPEARQLVESLLHTEDLPEKVRRLILDRAEGNPFFVEELIRALLDAQLVVRQDGHWRATREIASITLPNTLSGVITTRLDRLDEATRQIAQAAAVIGREFDFEVLADLVEAGETLEASLQELQRRELVREKSRLPRLVYRFKHVLTQEAAYASILLSGRRDLHLKAAEALIRIAADQPAEIARHFLEARQPGRAFPYLVEAGERAASGYSMAEASEHFAMALELKDAAADLNVVRRAYEGFGEVLLHTNQIPKAFEKFKAMLTTAESQGDVPMQVSALNKLASTTALYIGQFQEAEVYLSRADRLAHEHDVISGMAELSIIRCQMCTAQADFDHVIMYMDEMVEIGKKAGMGEHMAMGLEHISSSLMFLTRFEEAFQKAGEALEAARAIGDREHEAWVLCSTMPICLVCKGDLEGAWRIASQGAQLASRIGSLAPQMLGYWVLGEIARWQGKYEMAIDFGGLSLEAALPLEEFMPFFVVLPLGSLGMVYLDLSEHFRDEIAKFHKKALAMLESPAAIPGGGTAWADLGFCALTLGDLDIAEEVFYKGLNYPTMFKLVERPRYLIGSAQLAMLRKDLDLALELAEEARSYAQERQMRHLYAFIDIHLGQVYAVRGEGERALAHFQQAETIAGEFRFRPLVWQARAGTARVLDTLGRTEEAQALRKSAQEIIEEIAAEIQDERLRRGYLQSALRKLCS
jgi:predicted ATPase/class 3 adenylate cyclase